MKPRDDAIERLVERILDAEPCDWSEFEGKGDSRIDALRALADVADAFGRIGTTSPRACLFRWGPLDVLEHVAEGGTADVYRAHDARLGRDVALKLLKSSSCGQTRASRFLDEARRLARIRDRHVVSVFGAAIHDGRAGLWCEWIEGSTLAERVAREGPLGPGETALVGIGLCHALDAVHRAGLLHGDVKPHNVLRERGGRLVLADFGAGGEPARVNASLRTAASPAWLAPEVLDGAAREPRHDLYALGGVLQFLLSGSTPDPLRAGAVHGRADVPERLHAVIERARAADPGQRYASADEMARDLAACLPAADERSVMATTRASPASRRLRLAMAAAFAGALGTAIAILALRAPPLPEVQLALRRHDGTQTHVIAADSPIALHDRLSFAIESRQPVWLYVFNADDHGALHRLFPLPAIDTRNPLPAGREVEIPGRVAGRSMRIEVSSSARVEEFLVVAAPHAVEALESIGEPAALAASAGRLRGSAVLAPAAADAGATRIDDLIARLDATEDRLRVWHYRLPHRPQ